jgi:hypothetical protein
MELCDFSHNQSLSSIHHHHLPPVFFTPDLEDPSQFSSLFHCKNCSSFSFEFCECQECVDINTFQISPGKVFKYTCHKCVVGEEIIHHHPIPPLNQNQMDQMKILVRTMLNAVENEESNEEKRKITLLLFSSLIPFAEMINHHYTPFSKSVIRKVVDLFHSDAGFVSANSSYFSNVLKLLSPLPIDFPLVYENEDHHQEEDLLVIHANQGQEPEEEDQQQDDYYGDDQEDDDYYEEEQQDEDEQEYQDDYSYEEEDQQDDDGQEQHFWIIN